MNKRISIIVPIYNIENYINRCVSSLTEQTYKNIEIILVDDGSTDESGKICDKLSLEDDRIKVLHKTNGGLSDARNYGIEKSNSELIMFVDGDDWIEKDTVELVYEEYKKNQSDIVVFGMYIDYDNGVSIEKKPKKYEILDNTTAIIKLNSFKNIDVSAANKLFVKKLFDNIKFPVGKLSEDYFVMYRLFDYANKISVLPFCKYHYYQRINSITKGKKINYDYIQASKEQMLYLLTNYPNIKNVGETAYGFANISIFNVMISRNSFENVKEIKKEIKKYKKNVIKNKYLNVTKKIQYLFFIYLNPIYIVVKQIKNKSIRGK